MQNTNNLMAIKETKDLYNVMDSIASLHAYANNLGQPQWWIERKKNSRLYYPVMKTKDGDKFFTEAIKEDSPLDLFLKENSWSKKNLLMKINQAVLEQIKEDNWKVSRHSDDGVIRSLSFRPYIRQWSLNPELRNLYWKNRCESKDFGSEMDLKFFNLRDILVNKKATRENIKFIEKTLNSIISRKNNWELDASQSFRYWVSLNEDLNSRDRFNKILDKRHVSYRYFQDQTPVVLLAIENNKFDVLKGWMKETSLDCQFTPAHNEVPDRWWKYDEEKPSTNLWNWMCYIGSLDIIEKTLKDDPSLINSKDFSDKNALHWACLSANTKVIDFLISKGVDVSQEDIDGFIPAQLVPKSHDNLFDALEKYRIRNLKEGITSLLDNKNDNGIVY